MEITRQLVDKLAELSRLEFDDASRDEIMRDLKEIISFVERLREAEVDGADPLIHISDEENVLRRDVVKSEITRDEALKNAPLHDGTHLKVPKVIKK